MTGGDMSLETILAVVSAALGAIGAAFGWPALVKIADWIKARDNKAKGVITSDLKPLADAKELPVVPPKEVL